MTKSEHIFKDYFCGNKISAYGRENGYVDYATLAKSFDAVMSNDIISKTNEIGYWDQVNGIIDNYDEIEELREKIEELEDTITDDTTAEQDEQTRAAIRELEKQIEELEEEQDRQPEIFQYFIISDQGAEILKDYTDEQVFYNDELDMYVWGVTHWGTSWDYVLTDIPCEKEA